MKALIFFLSLSLVLCNSAFADIIFQDDFESYTVGTFPSLGGWVHTLPGGPIEISTNHAYTGSKSLRITAEIPPGGTAIENIYEDYLIFEIAVYIAEEEGETWVALILDYPSTPTMFKFKEGIIFIGYWDIDFYGVEIPYTTNTWYKLKAVCNFQNQTFDAYINDSNVATGLSTGGLPYANFDIGSVLGATSYFDDVKVQRDDGDGIPVDEDNCPDVSNPNQEDLDEDGVGDICDNCPNDFNPAQQNYDSDALGDVCDPDDDNDGICDPGETDPFCSGSDICPYDPDNDIDEDTICGDIDNCPDASNPNQEDVGDGDGVGDICDNCPNDYNPDQLDTYPPQGNGIGDACDCEADFDCDGKVDALDVEHFLWDFGRNEYNDPCTDDRWCYGDFLCDGSVDSPDVTKLLEDFGRNTYNNPCPACEAGDWCNYSESTTTTTAPITTSIITTTIPPECELTISPSSETVYTWETIQFGTTLNGDCDAPCYDWEVLTSVGSTIDSDGLYTAGGTAGIDTVTVTDNCNEDISDSATVEVFFPTTTVPQTTTTTAP